MPTVTICYNCYTCGARVACFVKHYYKLLHLLQFVTPALARKRARLRVSKICQVGTGAKFGVMFVRLANQLSTCLANQLSTCLANQLSTCLANQLSTCLTD